MAAMLKIWVSFIFSIVQCRDCSFDSNIDNKYSKLPNNRGVQIYVLLWVLMEKFWKKNKYAAWLFGTIDYLLRESYHLDRSLNVEFGVEYQMIFLTVAKTCILTSTDFDTPSRFRKGCVNSFQTLHSDSSFFSIMAENKK